jgi:hypothetical protein
MRWRLGLAALLTLFFAAGSEADPVRRANLLDLTEFSTVIVSGRVVDVTERLEPGNLPVRVVTLRIADVLKADDPRARKPKPGQTYRFKQWNDPSLRWTDLRMPSYIVGEDVLLFLAATSTKGLTSPLALDQGKFTIRTVQKRGRTSRSAVNARNNSNLPIVDPEQGVAPAARAAQGRSELARLRDVALTAADTHLLTRGYSGPVEYEQLARLVKKLARGRRSGGR